MKAFWYNDTRKNICGLKIRELRKQKKITIKQLSILAELAGYDYIAMDAELTRFGGIETRDEGLLYAKWLKEHEGQYDGVIFSMPIFADENGAITALQDAGVPILMQAYPDEIGKMDFAHRRDRSEERRVGKECL